MTQHKRPKTAGEFLREWYALVEAGDTAKLEQWEHQFPELAETAPDMTLHILRELATSAAYGAKEAAAIYARYAFHTRQAEITELLITLYQGGDTDIQEHVLSSIDFITSDKRLNPSDAVELITEIHASAPRG